MSDFNINVRLDAAAFVEHVENATKETVQAIRAGVNAAAVQAKREFINATSKDAAGKGATPARVKKQTSPIKRASGTDFTASFRVTGTGWNVSPLIVSVIRGNQHKIGGATISSHVETGGGSVNLSRAKFFVVQSNGGTVVLERTSKGIRPARGLRRGDMARLAGALSSANVKRIYAEGPRTAMAQDNAAPRKTFERVARAQLAEQIGSRLGVALNGGSPAGDGGD